MAKWRRFPDNYRAKSIRDLVKAYETGCMGAIKNEKKDAELVEQLEWAQASDACSAFGLAGSGKDKLCIPFTHILNAYPGCLPGPAQARGDCVSHSTKNAALGSLCVEIATQKPDEETGRIEGAPLVSAEGVENGVLSTEAIYWWRDHGGDGWSCSHATSVVMKESGIWLRQKHDVPGYGSIDLTKYSGSMAGKWGRSSPPSEVLNYGREHLVRTATIPNNFEELCDLFANGYFVTSCGGEGFSGTRNEFGVSSRQGGWSHAFAYIGTDSRKWAMDKYGGLVLCQNSWGKWNNGPRKIYGTTIEIPHGAFWAKYSDLRQRYMCAYSSVNGWPARKLPDWGANFWD